MAAVTKGEVCVIQARIGSNQVSLDMDTGSPVNILSKEAYEGLRSADQSHISDLTPSDVSLSGLEGVSMELVGKTEVDVCLDGVQYFPVVFYVATNFSLPSDGLLGYSTMKINDIDVLPRCDSISVKGTMYRAMKQARPLVGISVGALTSQEAVIAGQSSTMTDNKMRETRTLARNSSETSNEREADWSIQPMHLASDQRLGAGEVGSVTVRLKEARVGVDLVSMSETAKVKGVSLENTLSRVRAGLLTNVLIMNRTGETIVLKK